MHNLDSQPKYIKILILNYLPLRSLLKVSQLNKTYYKLVKHSDPVVWDQYTNFDNLFQKMKWKLCYYMSNTYHHNFHIKENYKKYLMAKVIPIFTTYDINDNTNYHNVDYLMPKFLHSQFKNLLVVKYHASLKTNIDTVNIPISIDKDKFGFYAKFINNYINDNDKYHNQVMTNICDTYKYGNLFDYLKENSRSMSVEIWISILFQAFFNLALIQSKYPSFKHNDFKASNIYLGEDPNYIDNTDNIDNYASCRLPGQKFRIKRSKFLISIHNFQFSSINGIIENSFITENWLKKLNVTSIPNKYIDIHYFCISLLYWCKEKYISLPKEINDFLHRVVPKKYRYGSLNVIKKTLRIIVNDEYTTPYNVIVGDKLFKNIHL